MAGLIPRASLVPGMVPDEILPSLWRHSIAAFFDAQPLDAADGGAARLPEIHQYHLGQALFIEASFSQQQFRRDAGWMARHDDADHLLLQLFARGSNRGSNGGQTFTERPGNIYAVNLSREVDAISTDADTLSLVLPRDLVLGDLPRLADASGAVFDEQSAAARIFVDHMLSLRSHLDGVTVAELPAIVQGTLGLLDSLARHGDVASSAAHSATLAAICRHIDRHLDDPTLGVDGLCEQFRCSRATVYRLFQPLGGVREHIQRRRLVGCFKAIVSPAQAHRRIFDIAQDFGFVSPSHFSSLFREYFGMTPRDAREAGTIPASALPADAPPAATAAGEAEMMWQWAKTLMAQAAPAAR